MKKLYLASKNQGKIEEYKKLLLNVNCQLLLQPESIEVEENGITFRENAIKKASEVSKKTRNYAIADDSGICIESLNWKLHSRVRFPTSPFSNVDDANPENFDVSERHQFFPFSIFSN